MNRVWLLRAAVVALVASSAAAQSPQRKDGDRPHLKQVGALHCLAWQAAVDDVTTRLSCALRIPNVETANAEFEGEMRGKGLYLVSPGPVQVLWNVLAPTRYLPVRALAGTYDTTSKHSFSYAQGNQNVLLGGMDDVVALELIGPTIDAIGPGTKLTLRQIRPEPAKAAPSSGVDDAS